MIRSRLNHPTNPRDWKPLIKEVFESDPDIRKLRAEHKILQTRLDCVRSELAVWLAQRKCVALQRHLFRLQLSSFRQSLNDNLWRKLFDPNQPRVPVGNPDGGQWTRVADYNSEEQEPGVAGGINDSRVLSDATDPILLGEQYAGNGHHYGVQSVYSQEKYSFLRKH